MTEPRSPWVGDLVHDPVAKKNATLSDVYSDGTHLLRAPGSVEWHAEDPSQLTVVTRRTDRDDW